MQFLILLAKMILDGTVPLLLLGGWLCLKILCWVLGAIGMKTIAAKNGIALSAYPYLPGWQSCAALRLVGKERLVKRANFLLWWGCVLFAVMIASLIWAVVFYLREVSNFWVILLMIIAALALVLAIAFYVLLRFMELKAVFKLVPKKGFLMLFLFGVGLFFLLPFQRIFIFAARNN